MRCLVSLDDVFVEFPRARELWIPAFAGMTECFFGRWSSGTVDSRLRGNGVGVVLCENDVSAGLSQLLDQ